MANSEIFSLDRDHLLYQLSSGLTAKTEDDIPMNKLRQIVGELGKFFLSIATRIFYFSGKQPPTLKMEINGRDREKNFWRAAGDYGAATAASTPPSPAFGSTIVRTSFDLEFASGRLFMTKVVNSSACR